MERSNNKFITSVFRKNTFTGLSNSFFSFCSYNFKLASIQTLLFRAFHVCSLYHLIHTEFEFLINYFFNNGYPKSLILKQIKKFFSKQFSTTTPSTTDESESFYFSFLYYGSQSNALRNDLKTLLTKFLPNIRTNIILVNNFRIGSLFRYKDEIPFHMRASLVYYFSCVRCTSAYVGMTRRNIYTRVCEHRGVSPRTGMRLASPPHSAIREHVEGCGSSISLDNFKILDSTKNETNLKILESLFINSLRPNLNNMQSSHPLKIVNSL